MARCLIPGNGTIQPYRSHFQFGLSVLSVVYPNTILLLFFSFWNLWVELESSLLKKLRPFQYGKEDKDLFCFMTVSQTPSRGDDPPGEAMYALDTHAWRLFFPLLLICQIDNAPEDRENKCDSHFMSWELWFSELVASLRLVSGQPFLLYLTAVCILKVHVFQDWSQQWGFCDKEGLLSLEIQSSLGTWASCTELYDE